MTLAARWQRLRHGAGWALLALMASGCQQWQPNKTPYSNPGRIDDEQWIAGADRPPTPKTLHSMARICIAQGRDPEAESILQKIIADNPRFLPAYVDLAEIQIRRRHLDRALQTLSSGLAAAPEDPVLLNDMGMCWVLQNNYEKALEFFTRAASSNPNTPRYLGNMAMALGMLGRYDESFALYQQILLPAEAHDNLAILCDARKDTARAARARAMAAEIRAASARK